MERMNANSLTEKVMNASWTVEHREEDQGSAGWMIDGVNRVLRVKEKD